MDTYRFMIEQSWTNHIHRHLYGIMGWTKHIDREIYGITGRTKHIDRDIYNIPTEMDTPCRARGLYY